MEMFFGAGIAANLELVMVGWARMRVFHWDQLLASGKGFLGYERYVPAEPCRAMRIAATTGFGSC